MPTVIGRAKAEATIAFIGSSQSGVCPSASRGAPGATRSSSRKISRSDAASCVCRIYCPRADAFSMRETAQNASPARAGAEH